MPIRQPMASANTGDKKRTKPKRALTAYNIFFKEERRRILEHGEAAGFAALAQAVAKRWKSISKEEYAIYVQKAAEDKERHRQEMSEWTKSAESNPAKKRLRDERTVVEEVKQRISIQQQVQGHGQQGAIPNMHAMEHQRQQHRNNAVMFRQQQELDNLQLLDVGAAASSRMNQPPHHSYSQREKMLDHTQSQPRPRDSRTGGYRTEGYRPEEPPPPESLHNMLLMQQRILLPQGAVATKESAVMEPVTGRGLSSMLAYDDLKYAAPPMQASDCATEQSTPDDKQHLTFTPGSLSRVFDMSAEDMASIPEPLAFYRPDFPAADEVAHSTEELLNQILDREGDKKPPAKGSER